MMGKFIEFDFAKVTSNKLLWFSTLFVLSLQINAQTENVVRPEIPLEILNENGLVVFQKDYKSRYPKFLPYFFLNQNNVFNGVRGDFVNVSHPTLKNINITVNYYESYGKYKNALTLLIALSETSKKHLSKTPILVKSENSGLFRKVNLKHDRINRVQQRTLFVLELSLNNPLEIIEKVKDDFVTLTVGSEKYIFLNPEITIDQLQD